MYPLAPVTHIVWPDGEVEAEATAGSDKVVVRRPAADAPVALLRKSLRDEVVADSSDRASARHDKNRPASRANVGGGILFIFAMATGTSTLARSNQIETDDSSLTPAKNCQLSVVGEFII